MTKNQVIRSIIITIITIIYVVIMYLNYTDVITKKDQLRVKMVVYGMNFFIWAIITISTLNHRFALDNKVKPE